MPQSYRPKRIQGLILDQTTSRILQDESCAPTHASRSAAFIFMLQSYRPERIQPSSSV